MKNLNSLLARLGTLSLAAALVFSVANAATIRKDSKAAAAVIEALVQKAVEDDAQVDRATRAQAFTDDVVVGSATSGKNLTVYGEARVKGDVVAGAIGTPGRKYIIGQQALNPRTQQLELRFKDKAKTGEGAFVDLEFITTATSYRTGAPDIGKATVAVNVHGIYCHPQMTPAQIMGIAGTSRANMKYTTTSRVFNGPARTEVMDFHLTPTVRVEAITKDVSFGFVPFSANYPVTGSSTNLAGSAITDAGFYEANWSSRAVRPVWDAGTVIYRVASGNLSGFGVSTSVSDSLQTVDVFDLFSDDDLQTLLASLNAYFGNDSTKVREYLMENRHRLSRAFKALKA